MKRLFSLAALLALGFSLVFAGGGQQGSGGQQGGAAPAANKTITINTWAEIGDEEGWKAAADGYRALHPDVTIVIDLKPSEGYGEWLHNIFATSNPNADIVNVNLAWSSATGKSVNFLEYVDQKSPYSNGRWRDQFNFQLQTVDLARQDLIVLNLESVQVLWEYNKDIFAKVGVKPPKTWNELIAVCEKLQAAGYQPISIAGDFNSFWAMEMGWLAQIYADQTTRSMINTTRAQRGDYLYDPDIDGVWKYDPSDPYNDDAWKVNQNPVRFYKAVAEGQYKPDAVGMRTVWENFAKVFPKYAGGDAFFGTKDALPLFYQGKAAMMVNGAWGLSQFKNDMAKLAKGQAIESNNQAISGAMKFELGTFNMPSMEGPGIEAKARTIEVGQGFLGVVKKDKAHNDLVMDFLMYYSSKAGYSRYLTASLEAGGAVAGPPLVYGVELPPDYQAMFDNLSFIGNVQKGFGAGVARGIGDVQEALRAFYDYSYNYLSGRTTVDQWLSSHKASTLQYLDQAMAIFKISRNDLRNPQNAPTGQ
ncbi:MAG: extracellular solute-binding protein [Spirochaetaceae bacterium]|nr:extracellular solute-binding protein [Spirochaetaceae bacterium]